MDICTLEAFEPSLGSTPEQQMKIMQYYDDLRNSENGWKLCVDNIFAEKLSETVRFFCLQVIEAFLKKKYASASPQEQLVIRSFLERFLTNIKCFAGFPSYLKNKFAQIYALAFVVDFPSRWMDFIKDLFFKRFLNGFDLVDSDLCEFYCRFMVAIDIEVASRELQRTKQECDRNTVIKDQMRLVYVSDLVETWYQILVRFMPTEPLIINTTWNILAAYISWIDISLVASERFIALLLKCLEHVEFLEAASDCLCSLIAKGMDAKLKLQLIVALEDALNRSPLFTVLNESTSDAVYQSVANTANAIGCELLECWNKLSKQDSKTEQVLILDLLQQKCPLLLKCLSHTDVEVSSAVSDFLHRYLIFLKQLPSLNSEQKSFVEKLLLTIQKRYRYPEDYDFIHEDENEAVFLEFRTDLKTLFTNIGQLDLTLFFDSVKNVVENTLHNWRRLTFQEVEAAIMMLYHLGEVVKFNPAKPGPVNEKIFAMVQLLVKSDVSRHSHPAVVLAYFETVCRYDRSLAMDRELVLNVVSSFLDQRGLHNPNPKIVCRAIYLFMRFIRNEKLCLAQFARSILNGLQDLMDGSRSLTPLLRPEQQVFLYESIGMLIVSGNFQNEEKRHFLQQVLATLIERFNQHLPMLDATTGTKERATLAEYLNSVMVNCSRLTKGFSGQLTAKNCECQDIFIAVLKGFTEAVIPTRCELLKGYKQYLHRMVLCLEDDFLSCLPKCLQCFAAAVFDFKSTEDLVTLLQQVVVKYKDNACSSLEPVFPTVFRSIWKTLGYPIEENNETSTRESLYLKRSYYQLLCVIFSAKLCGILHNQAESVIQPLMESIVDGFACTDLIVKKSLINVVRLLINVTKDIGPPNKEYLERFLMDRGIPLCFALPYEDGFDFDDAVSLQIVNEVGLILKDIFAFKAEEMFSFLDYILISKVPAPLLEELCLAVKQCDARDLQKYLRTFFVRLKHGTNYAAVS